MTQPGEKAALPRAITRPLFGGALLLSALLVFVVGWSVYAPIATTIHVSGILISSRPSYEVQHPYGGQIRWIGVRPHQQITAGQVLLRFDVEQEKQALIELNTRITDLTGELKVIGVLLSDGLKPSALQDMKPQQFVEQNKIEERRATARRQAADTLRTQAAIGEEQVALLEQRVALLSELEQSQSQLLEQGLTRNSEINKVRNELLGLSGDLLRQHAMVLSQRAEASQLESEAALIISEFHAMLLGAQRENRSQLAELRQRYLSLQDIVLQSEVSSPISGQIQSLAFDTTQMYAARGDTLFVVSQILQQPRVQMIVPVNAVDQVLPGMTGKLTIPSLPSRDMPALKVVVQTVLPEATKDSDGNALGYVATAEIEASDMSRARNQLRGRFRLSTDMPVNVALSGRATTLAEYLFRPLASIYAQAFQD